MRYCFLTESRRRLGVPTVWCLLQASMIVGLHLVLQCLSHVARGSREGQRFVGAAGKALGKERAVRGNLREIQALWVLLYGNCTSMLHCRYAPTSELLVQACSDREDALADAGHAWRPGSTHWPNITQTLDRHHDMSTRVAPCRCCSQLSQV
jgi:hypothetical protein